MNKRMFQTPGEQATNEREVRALYSKLLESWDKRDAKAFAALFNEDGESIGFDGSQLIGQAEIFSTLKDIFDHHPTPPYIYKIKNVRFLQPDVATLRAIVGMVPPGKTEIDPALNSIQTIVATRHNGEWCIASLQNTPAQLHGRPELVQQMTEELREVSEHAQ
ncbi:SgcJ/EcaC family oxidoreductase [Ktedonobacter racemifer]|uniref:DUF4440 domain-containing protein n=1 Tax=Ktedonobacter racemifer DSM 44963 TaxID=485913 RepID=D6TYF9_KTERA|nr:SgcJ/EcaC family oxidoreductase [Ktedonobacter racemifer]EFH83239.1 conserved hypothetical protein [Ktedonobacter racemifer DSM 44963]